MKHRLAHISPLIIGLMCLLIADTMYIKNIKAGPSFKTVTPYTQSATKQSFFAYVVENSFGY
jgi:hypothetical protein